jgi:putative tricarboxylic transport membrane protein
VRPSFAGPRLIGGALLAIGVVALLATFAIPSSRYGWSASGPRFAPLLASIALILLALAFLVRTVVKPDIALAEFAAEAQEQTHWPTPGLLALLLVGYALTLTALGYALATLIFFWLTSWLLGSDRPGRDAVVGLILGVVASYAFSHWLNVQLPTGPWGV